jgi:hypothetical protein
MLRFKTPVTIWKSYRYRCEKCGCAITIHLQEGVEGPDRNNYIPSPFSINCPNWCDGLCPMLHASWHLDAEINPPRLAKDGEYVFLYDNETGHGLPVKIVDSEFWLAKTFGHDNPQNPLWLPKAECNQDKLEARLKREEEVKRLFSQSQ